MIRFTLILLCCFVTIVASSAAEPAKTIELWPGTPPGEKGELGPEHDTTKASDNLVAGKRVIRLGNVSKPTISFYLPPSGKNCGTAVVVCPGGGYNILAMDLEGTEVCDWLNSLGITGVLLKYRVPARAGGPRHAAPLQDVQRALGLVRSKANEWGIASNRIGVLGFSAGGHLGAALSNNCDSRSYPAVDAADEVNCRPDFAVLIYPGGLVPRDSETLAPEVQPTSSAPPTFIAMAADDPVRVENAFAYAIALKKVKVPLELHIYPSGGHGYGLRPRADLPVTTWPERARDWMKSRGLLEGK